MGEAVNTAVYLYNRTPHSELQFKTPYQVLNNIRPDITNIRVFGSVAYYKVKAIGLKKLDPRAKKAILLGFGNNLYRLYDTESKRLIWARDVKILENQFHNFKEADLEANQESLFDLNQITDKQINKQNRTVEQNQSVQQNQTRQNQISRINQFSDSEDDDIDELALLGTYQNEPKSYKEARNSPDWPHWLTAMGVEIDQLNKQKTWIIVDLPPNRTALKTRWVYKIKTNKNNKIIKYKARWVVKGFSQIYGIDYEETFANTCRPEVYKMLLYLAAYHNWEVVQWDFKNAFPHADVDKELYIE